MPAVLDQLDVGVRECPEELTPPHPGTTGQRFLWFNDDSVRTAHLKVVADKPAPLADFPQKRLRLLSHGGCSQDEQDSGSHGGSFRRGGPKRASRDGCRLPPCPVL